MNLADLIHQSTRWRNEATAARAEVARLNRQLHIERATREIVEARGSCPHVELIECIAEQNARFHAQLIEHGIRPDVDVTYARIVRHPSTDPALSQGSDPGQPLEDDDGAVTLHGLSIAVAVALVMLAAVIDSRWPAVVALVVILPAFCQAVKREPDGIEERERVNAALKERA